MILGCKGSKQALTMQAKWLPYGNPFSVSVDYQRVVAPLEAYLI